MIFALSIDRNAPYEYAYAGYRGYDHSVIYWNFFRMLVWSIDHLHKKPIIAINAINFNNENKQEVLDLLSKPIIYDKEVHFTDQVYYHGFLVTDRIPFIRRLLVNFEEPVLFLDIDILVRKSLDALFGIIKEHDFSCLLRSNKIDTFRFQCGVMGFSPTKNAKKLLRTWEEKLPPLEICCAKNEKGRSLGGDQTTLWYAYSSMKKALDFENLNLSFNDGDFKDDSSIWHGHKGNKIGRLKDIQKEFKRLFGDKAYERTNDPY